MTTRTSLCAAAAAALVLIPAAALSASPTETFPAGTFKVTNDSHKVVECTFLLDGHTWAYLKVHQGKTYHSDFGAGRSIQLVCIRAHPDVFGPLKTGIDYRFRDGADGWVALSEAPTAAP